jgi:E3 ubiquitin-protein ligase MYCBP2
LNTGNAGNSKDNNEVLINCNHCNCSLFFSKGKLNEAPDEDPLNPGKKLLQKHRLHYVENRFKCPNSECKHYNDGQCLNCGAIPYHLGYTCEEF